MLHVVFLARLLYYRSTFTPFIILFSALSTTPLGLSALIIVCYRSGRRWRSEKAEWPLSHNANFEQPVDPSAPFDYNAVPSTFYFDIEASGSIPVRDAVTQGLDILATNLAKVIEGVEIETGGRDEDEEEEIGGLVEPTYGGGEGYGGGGGGGYYGGGGGDDWQGGNGMSPLRR